MKTINLVLAITLLVATSLTLPLLPARTPVNAAGNVQPLPPGAAQVQPPKVAVDAIPGGAIDFVRAGLTVGGAFNVDIVAQNIPAPGLGSVSFDLVYDQTVINGISVIPGPMTAGMTVSAANPDEDSALSLGRARFACAFAAPQSSGPSGNGTLATFSFSVGAIGMSGAILRSVSLSSVNGTALSPLAQNASLSSGFFSGISVPGFGVEPSPAMDGTVHTIGPITVMHAGPSGAPITITQVIAGAGLLLSPTPAWVRYGGAAPVPFIKPKTNAPISEIVWKGPWILPDNGSSLQLWFFAASLEPGHLGQSLDLHVRVTGAMNGQPFSVKQAVDRPIQPCGDSANKCLSGVVRDGIHSVVIDGGQFLLDNHANPLKGATVELRQGGATVAGPIATDQAGAYRFTGLASGSYQVRATLRDGEVPSPNHIFEVVHYEPFVPLPPAVWIEVKVTINDGDTSKAGDLAFSNAETIDASNIAVANRPRLDDMANIFFRLRQYVDWLKGTLNVSFSTANRPAPVEVFAYSLPSDPNNAIYRPTPVTFLDPPTTIHIGTGLSPYSLRDARENDAGPESVEWHEFTHHIFGANISETAISPPDSNHGGYNNLSTLDSLDEGLAAFLPALAWQFIEGGADSNYDHFGVNLEVNSLKAWGAVPVTLVPGATPQSVEREEFAVAALLWDIVDARNDQELTQVVAATGAHIPVLLTDNVNIPIQTLWSIIASAKPTTVAALRDALIASPLVPAAFKTVNIHLDGNGVADVSQLDVLFLMHGFYPVNPNTISIDFFTNLPIQETDSGHWHYLLGTPVGRTDHVDADGPGPGTALTLRQNTPRAPKSNLRINVQDANGNPLSGATVSLEVVYPELTDTIERSLDAGTGNLIYLELPPYFRGRLGQGQPLPPCNPLTGYNVTVTLTATRNGITSPQQFQFNNCQYTQAMAAATGDFALEFTFTFPAGSDEAAPSVSLNAPTGGEILPQGSPFPISWSSSDNLGVTSHEIQLSTNSGLSFSAIATNLSGSQQSFIWNVPDNVCTAQARIRVMARDAAGNTSQATSGIFTIRDARPPTITDASVDKPVLWPPNHKMEAVTVNYQVTDNCNSPLAITCRLSVASNEPINGTGDGDTAPDWEIVDSHHVRLRAERAGAGNGRIYTITITCTDGQGNSSSQTLLVRVPKS